MGESMQTLARNNSKSPSNAKATNSRQQPGLACNECRNRKLRCDRARPKCGTCRTLRVPCEQNVSRQRRGPKPGYIKALRDRIDTLERLLVENPDGSDESSDGPPYNDVPRRMEETEQQGGYTDEAPGPPHDYSTDERTIALDEPYVELDNEPYVNSLVHMQTAEDEQNQNRHSSKRVFTPSEEHQTDHPLYSEQSQSAAARYNLNGHTNSIDFLLTPTDAMTADKRTLSQMSQMLSSFDRGSQNSFDGLASLMTMPPVSTEATSFQQSLLGNIGGSYTLTSEFPTAPSVAPNPPLEMTPLICADLDHLYFDRVHLSVPFLNQRRYFARVSQTQDSNSAFTSLRYAMWILASSVGTQFQHVQSKLYSYTRTLLETSETMMPASSMPIEYIQAWILIAIYEITQDNYQLGWITAGRCFRLTQLLKLHEIDIDRSDGSSYNSNLSWTELESWRRTFWVAYMVDRCINLIDNLPLAFDEHIIGTRLPAPESDFQREKPVKTEFLHGVVTQRPSKFEQPLQPFTDSIVLLTLGGRHFSSLQQHIIESASGNKAKIPVHHEWLDQILSRNSQAPLANDDDASQPMLHFASTVAHSTILFLCMPTITGQEERALQATRNIVCLSQRLA